MGWGAGRARGGFYSLSGRHDTGAAPIFRAALACGPTRLHILRAAGKRTGLPTTGDAMATRLPKGYKPSEDEPFMNAPAARVFPAQAVGLERGAGPGVHPDAATSTDRQRAGTRPRGPRLRGVGTLARTADPRPGTQAAGQDRRRPGTASGRQLRLLRGNRRADRPVAPRRTADRDAEHRGSGTSRENANGPTATTDAVRSPGGRVAEGFRGRRASRNNALGFPYSGPARIPLDGKGTKADSHRQDNG